MCFHLAFSKEAILVRNRYQADHFDFEEDWMPVYHINGFNNPPWPVITNHEPKRIQRFNWGLIPFWTKDQKAASQIKKKTLNARSESVFEKPSYKKAIRHRRCLVPATGFFEWRTEKGNKYPYYIYLKNQDIFSMAGIWESWEDKDVSGHKVYTFSILTTRANTLMEKIHNTKKRMPVILSPEDEDMWLSPKLKEIEIKELTAPSPSHLMASHTISKSILSPNSNRADILNKIEYPELTRQPSLL